MVDKNKEKITDATEVSTTELAIILGLSVWHSFVDLFTINNYNLDVKFIK